jgi:hypothetical protein
MLMPQSKMKMMRAPELLSTLAAFTGLHYNRDVLHDKNAELKTQCEAPDRPVDPHAADFNKQPPAAKGKGRRGKEKLKRVMVNTHSTYDGDDAQRRSQLDEVRHASRGPQTPSGSARPPPRVRLCRPPLACCHRRLAPSSTAWQARIGR